MENICCIVCDKNNTVPFIKLKDRLAHGGQVFQLVKCECNFVYLNPRPDNQQISSYYASSKYDPHNTNNEDAWGKMYRLIQQITLRWKYNKITSIQPFGTLLDIGGGKGEFAVYMSSKGWDVVVQDSISGETNFNAENNIDFVKAERLISERLPSLS